MADKSIGQLVAATQVTPTDLFVLEQSNTAKKLTGQVLENWLLSFADGHGGIQSIAKTGTSGLTDTYTITLSDTTTITFTVTNGKAISGVTTYYAVSTSATTVPSSWSTTKQNMTASKKYLWSYQRINFNDNTNIDTTKTVIGVYGDKGDKGDTGNGISSLAQTGRVVGQYTTYTFTMTDGTTKTFQSYDGAGISDIQRTSSVGLVDTYTVTLTDGNTETFTVTNAKSITSVAMVSGSHAPGTTDTYRITFNDGDTSEFTVYNGTNGTGAVSSVDGIQASGQDVILMLTGNGAPTTSTVGQRLQRYFDLTNHVLYICTSVNTGSSETTYTWSGTGVQVDSALSTMSSNPVQNKAIASKFATIETNIAAKLPLAGGTMSGAIAMGNKKITNLATPTANGDAVNKSYADTKYTKPSTGIPKTDLASAVQTSLGKADTALQSVPSTYRTSSAQDTIDATMAKANEVGIVITGKRPSTAVTVGQYVIVRNSTISGISDGLYTAKAALSPSTDVTAANLMAVSAGGLNSLLSVTQKSVRVYEITDHTLNTIQNIPLDYNGVFIANLFVQIQSYTANDKVDVYMGSDVGYVEGVLPMPSVAWSCVTSCFVGSGSSIDLKFKSLPTNINKLTVTVAVFNS